ncbi:MAG: glyoxylate/hydroxypyruvate reductase A, partial [Rhodospirillales bacterium]|nr:glyoxylate/hydroxypyruvate reductase A [Rhodospirillales bacterium]
MSVFLFISPQDKPERWRTALRPHFPDMDFRVWPGETGDPSEVDLILTWRPPTGSLTGYPNLKAVYNLGAGVELLVRDPSYPVGVPLIRLVDPGLTSGMTEYMVHMTLTFHRGFHQARRRQRDHVWKEFSAPSTAARRVGILGLGVLGRDSAEKLAGLGFQSIAGWSRTAKAVPGVECFSGTDGLMPFLRRTEILICLLPLTAETVGILNADTLAALPPGAFVINAARGGHVIEADLLAALDSGHIAGAALDVFQTE